MLQRGERAWLQLRADQPSLEPESEAFIAELLERVKQTWPDSNAPDFIVAFPYACRRKIVGMTGPAHAKLWRAALATGLYVPVTEADWRANVCRQYQVRLDFAPDAGLHTLEQALGALLDSATIRSAYSPHYARRVRNALASGAGTGDNSAHAGPFANALATATVDGGLGHPNDRAPK